ncbi:hypothetical protein NKR23_g10212 [Pleurostoma richardsiae]|uniref:Uncharacterized protein n=1 Tax=Pleurostoma richardsiae TaxID=41990 RepID=A0AA38VIX8_9PEZI|nr:hypothetical protein NKR23_g10212 [Pleurostoma richardsiae]
MAPVTPTTPLGPTLASLFRRQTTVTVTAAPSDSSSSGSHLSGGAIAGIVIGSIVGVLLIIWIIRSCSNLGAPPQERAEPAWYDDVNARRSRSRRRSHSANYPQRTSTEMRTVTPVVVADRVRRPSNAYVYESSRSGSKRDRRSRRGSRDYY